LLETEDLKSVFYYSTEHQLRDSTIWLKIVENLREDYLIVFKSVFSFAQPKKGINYHLTNNRKELLI